MIITRNYNDTAECYSGRNVTSCENAWNFVKSGKAGDKYHLWYGQGIMYEQAYTFDADDTHSMSDFFAGYEKARKERIREIGL